MRNFENQRIRCHKYKLHCDFKMMLSVNKENEQRKTRNKKQTIRYEKERWDYSKI